MGHGWFFLTIAWFQLAWAVIAYRRGTRPVLVVGAVVNAAIIAVWAVSRTAGLPFGPDAGTTEPAGFPDIAATAFEAVIVAGSLALAASPALAGRRMGSVRAAASLTTGMAAAALLTASLALTPNLGGEHHHGDEADHDHAAAADDDGTESASSDNHAHDHGLPGAATATAATTGHDDTASGPWDGNSPCEESGFTETGGADPQEGHNHHGATPQKPIDEATMAKLASQQSEARKVAGKYPTVADAEADGYRKSTAYLPCIGAHYTKISLVARFDPSAPSELLFDGTEPDSKIVGLSYLIVHDGEPEGFAGPNDHWHQHNKNGGLCLNDAGVVVGGESTSKADCEARKGHKVGLENIWMLHDWVVPGWECTWGVFAGQCPELGGKVGGTAFAT